MLLSTRPFRVGERVRLQGGQIAGTIDGIASSLGLDSRYIAYAIPNV